jgi:hypothetical protein
MRTGTGLALICVGAILAFAVRSNPSFFNWNIAGWVIMVVGILGLAIPRSGYAWVGRRLFVRQARGRSGDGGDQVIYPTGVDRNPANSRVPAALPGPGRGQEAPAQAEPARNVSTSPEDMRPGETEIVEDIYEN